MSRGPDDSRAPGRRGWKLTAGPAALDAAGSALIDGFGHVEVAPVSDAIEQITGRRMYMSHRMRPIFEGAKFAGFAVSVLLKQEEGHQGSAALSGMLAAIDEVPPDSVYVMAVDNGADIAGMGALMGTAMAVRDFAGAVIDGGTRDVGYLRKIAFLFLRWASSRRPWSITIDLQARTSL
jgi:regulator of RNase E activity RraA